MYIFEVLVGWKKLGSNLMGAGIDTDVLYYLDFLGMFQLMVHGEMK
jgi:hypothetical protein